MRYAMIGLILSLAVPRLAAPAEVVCDGVLGNSGEQGSALVSFAAPRVRGLGVAYDRFGSLWDRGGAGQLNRYAPDGRLLAQYPLPTDSGGRDQITLVGDLLVLLLGNQLYTLPVDAAAGVEPTKIDVRCDGISFGATAGRILAFDKNGVFVVDPVAGSRKPLLTLSDVDQVELAADRSVYVKVKDRVHKFLGGNEVTDCWPKRAPGERMQLCDGFWFGHAWHGTIRRYDVNLSPEPGVVLGGASGTFIGHLDQNSELSNARGLAKLRDGLFAASGIEGTMHLLAWHGERRQFEIVRRIGCVPAASGLGLDRSGNVWWHAGSWRWDDRPDAPLRFGVNAPDGPVAQAVMLDDDRMVTTGLQWGKPTIFRGPLTSEISLQRIEEPCDLRRDAVATAVYRSGDKLVLLSLSPGGEAVAVRIGGDGAFQGNEGPVTLKTATPVKQWTSLATKDADTLLAAADGYVIELTRDGANWTERRRFNSFGNTADAAFGSRIAIAADAGRLWVADSERHRVVVLDLASGNPLATFGMTDTAGDDLGSLNTPTTITARGQRAVVFDSENQRLMKLGLR
jgi:hypothetical protein